MRIHTLSPPHTYILIEKDADDDVDTDDDDHPRILESPPSNQSPPRAARRHGTRRRGEFEISIHHPSGRRATSDERANARVIMTRGGRRTSSRRPVPSRARARDVANGESEGGDEKGATASKRRGRGGTTGKTRGHVGARARSRAASANGTAAATTTTARAFADGKIGGPTRKSAKGGWTPEEVRI